MSGEVIETKKPTDRYGAYISHIYSSSKSENNYEYTQEESNILGMIMTQYNENSKTLNDERYSFTTTYSLGHSNMKFGNRANNIAYKEMG